MKEIMAKLSIMIAFTKGADKIVGLVESLEESGNPQLVSALRTWVKEDFGVEIDGDIRQGKEDISILQAPTPEKWEQQTKSTADLISSGTKLIDKVMSNMDKQLIEQLERHLIGKASKIVNQSQFCSTLPHQNVLDESDVELKSGPELEEQQRTERAIKAACSKGAIGSLVLSLQLSGNELILEETLEWLETLQGKKKNYPISVKSLASQRNAEESTALRSTFFEQAALPHGLTKLATFRCQQKSATKGISAVQFHKERMMACSTDGTLNLWNWRGNEEEPIKIAVKGNNITCFQYDEEIIVLGTSRGTVHLLDSRTFEEKSAVYLSETVTSLKFVESTLVVFTRRDKDDELWWVDISRPDMQLLNPKYMISWRDREDQVPRICMYPDVTFLYYMDFLFVYDTKSGKLIPVGNTGPCPFGASVLIAGDLFCTKRVLVAGCTDGSIRVWNTSELMRTFPEKTLRGHKGPIVSLCAVSGHLLSLDKTGKLLMWFGYDLKHLAVGRPIPRVLTKNFSNVSNLAAHERWFASGSNEDGTVNIWTLPDLWLHAR